MLGAIGVWLLSAAGLVLGAACVCVCVCVCVVLGGIGGIAVCECGAAECTGGLHTCVPGVPGAALSFFLSACLIPCLLFLFFVKALNRTKKRLVNGPIKKHQFIQT